MGLPACGGGLLRSACRDPLLIDVQALHLAGVLAEHSANSWRPLSGYLAMGIP